MKTSLKAVRGLQLVGAGFLAVAVTEIVRGSYLEGGTGWKILLGIALIIGARTYDWFTRE